MSKRPSLTKAELRERLAAALRDVVVEVDGKLERAIPYEHARQLTADQIISLFNFDHGIHHAIDGPNEHWNYTARLIPEHREKTHKIDRPQIRKTDRIGKAHAAFVSKVLAKAGADSVPVDAKPAPRMRSRKLTSRSSFPPGRKLQSRKMRSASCSKPR